MINIEIDGIWCPKCRDFHPVLYWHEKYDDYEMNRHKSWLETKKKHPLLFQDAEYVDTLPDLDLEECTVGLCVICKTPTHFRRISNGHYVCSNECKFADGFKTADPFSMENSEDRI